MNNEPLMSIENPTLVHFRHFRALLTNFFSTSVVSALQIRPFMQNKPNFQKSQMNVSSVTARNYINELRTMNYELLFKTKPIYRGVSSMNRICRVYGSTMSFDSAKMAQYMNNWNLINVGKKKFNFLKYKRLNSPALLSPLTGTPFAHLNPWNFLYTDYTQ
jgi:hypothetical protein